MVRMNSRCTGETVEAISATSLTLSIDRSETKGLWSLIRLWAAVLNVGRIGNCELA